ncbi:MAG: hypothetical protein LW857_01260 [Verrucomicrobiae bacterium]|jgi:hypothetical protein|nr:hypothetical protein [Verrucomicrobiae bacterium]
MARNLFVLSALSFVLVGCFGPDKAPSPVTDGGPVFTGAPLIIDNGGLVPVPAVTAPAAKPATPAPTKKAPGTRLPIDRAGNK